jgi:hypothetical protein
MVKIFLFQLFLFYEPILDKIAPLRLKMLANNRRIQSGEEEADGFDRSSGKSRFKAN